MAPKFCPEEADVAQALSKLEYGKGDLTKAVFGEWGQKNASNSEIPITICGSENRAAVRLGHQSSTHFSPGVLITWAWGESDVLDGEREVWGRCGVGRMFFG